MAEFGLDAVIGAIVVLFLLFLVSLNYNRRYTQVTSSVAKLKGILKKLAITYTSKMLDFDVYVSDNGYTRLQNNRDIYIVVWNADEQRPYTFDTVLIAGIHELAHVVCKQLKQPEYELYDHHDRDGVSEGVRRTKEHSVEFETIEKDLLKLAVRFGDLSKTFEFEKDYPALS